jgi:subtilase family serine protease
LDIYGSKIYFTKDTGVYSMDITATQPSETPIFNYVSTSKYGVMYGFAVEKDKIYIADGGDFASNSKAYVYSLTGTLQKDVTVGVAPNGFYFNN